MSLCVALLHYPMVNKKGQSVVTSVTNFDIHDIARASRTYGVDRYFIVTPVELQRDFVQRIILHWIEGDGIEQNPTRGDALGGTVIASDLVEVGETIERELGGPPFWIATSARPSGHMMKIDAAKALLEKGKNVCLIFGTGHGLHPEVMELADAVLEPINGPTPFNHLSVRSAVSIYLDRLRGR